MDREFHRAASAARRNHRPPAGAGWPVCWGRARWREFCTDDTRAGRNEARGRRHFFGPPLRVSKEYRQFGSPSRGDFGQVVRVVAMKDGDGVHVRSRQNWSQLISSAPRASGPLTCRSRPSISKRPSVSKPTADVARSCAANHKAPCRPMAVSKQDE